MMTFIWNLGTGLVTSNRQSGVGGGRGRGGEEQGEVGLDLVETATLYYLLESVAVWHCECTKYHRPACLKMVTFMLHEFHLKIVLKI